jgi:hypothetical protein
MSTLSWRKVRLNTPQVLNEPSEPKSDVRCRQQPKRCPNAVQRASQKYPNPQKRVPNSRAAMTLPNLKQNPQEQPLTAAELSALQPCFSSASAYKPRKSCRLVRCSNTPLRYGTELNARAHNLAPTATKLRSCGLKIQPAALHVLGSGGASYNTPRLPSPREKGLLHFVLLQMRWLSPENSTLNRTFCKSTQAGGVTIERTCNKGS